jgi:hypothetical protein
MGMSIHYSGRAGSYSAVNDIFRAAQMFCAPREWMFACYDDPLGEMEDRDPDDPGYVERDRPIRGMVIRPHKKCEPVRLEFSVKHELEAASTKTQFAPFRVHVEIVKLLREIEPLLDEFTVTDETQLWETGDEAAAQARFDALRQTLDEFAAGLEEHGMQARGPGAASGEPDPLSWIDGDTEEEEERPYG